MGVYKKPTAHFRSRIGGNLRLKVPNKMKFSEGGLLKTAVGKNVNSFYQVEETPASIISAKAVIVKRQLKETFLYDLPTVLGKTYSLIAI
ncbi:MAG TPA: hypothetical protein VGQ04_13775 [Chitinophagaceae bacterium]|nr:hypothetical protein [Chitinophagaceae bacterium]